MTAAVYTDATSTIRPRRHAGVWYLFVAAVSTASLLPLLGLPFVQHLMPSTMPALYLFAVLNLLGGPFHVAATGWFYTDRTMLAYFLSRPVRYLVVPCVLVAGSAAVFQFIDRTWGNYLVAAYFAWQLWHYQKQNVGLLSFIAAGTDKVSISAWERRTLAVAAIAGILGFFRIFDVGLPNLAAVFETVHRVGAAVYLLVPVTFGIALVKNPALRTNRLRLVFFTLGALFFLPTFIFGDPVSAVFGYALAHGLQYLVFMGFVSIGKKNAIVSLLVLLIVATLGYLVLIRAMNARAWLDFPYSYAVYGAFLGVVMTHFVLDAGIWRLREPFQRGYMREKFYFIFNR